MGAKIPKIDQNNEVIGETTIREARQNGWPRRVARLFIFDQAKEQLLLQKRSLESVTFPGRWDIAGGHVDVGETYEEAAAREVVEELSLVTKAVAVAEPKFFENTFYMPCFAVVDQPNNFSLKLDEVSEVTWVTVEVFEAEIAAHPNEFTHWLLDAWKTYKHELLV